MSGFTDPLSHCQGEGWERKFWWQDFSDLLNCPSWDCQSRLDISVCNLSENSELSKQSEEKIEMSHRCLWIHGRVYPRGPPTTPLPMYNSQWLNGSCPAAPEQAFPNTAAQLIWTCFRLGSNLAFPLCLPLSGPHSQPPIGTSDSPPCGTLAQRS